MSTDTITRTIDGLTKDTIYGGMRDAYLAASQYMADHPDTGFVFQIGARNGEVSNVAQTQSAADLLKVMDDAIGGFSVSSVFEAVRGMEAIALEHERTATKHKKHGDVFVTISPSFTR